jgi:osmotically-inducible protein OsmY
MAARLVRVVRVLLMLVASAIVAEAAQQHVRLTDQQIKAQVEHRLIDHDGFDDQIRYAAAVRIYNDPLFWNYAIQVNPPIHIVVKHGRVTLSGVVISEVERRKAEQIARSIFGVLSVENKLRPERER